MTKHGVVGFAAAILLASPAAAQTFHTEPSCWAGPRIYHPGPPSEELARKIERTPDVTRTPRDNAIMSPNGAYQAWLEMPNRPDRNVADQILYVASEQGRVTRFYIAQAQLGLRPSWINEKLLFARISWGRVVYTDIIIDAESGEFLYQEEARFGQSAYEQYKQVCGNTCPCDPGVLSETEVPVSAPAEGEVIGHLLLNSLLNHTMNANVAPSPKTRQSPLPVFVEANGSRLEIARLTDPKAVLTNEHQEWESALVYARAPGWYRIKLSGKAGRDVWVREADTQGFTPMTELLTGSLAYLDEDWDGRLWHSPDGTNGYTRSAVKDPGLAREEYAAEFTEIRETESGPWLQVKIYDTDGCQRDESDLIATGWIPAWSEDGKLAGNYYARGC